VCRVAHRAYENARRSRERAARRDGRLDREITAAIAVAQRRQREIRVVRLPGANMPIGALACSDKRHPFVPDAGTGSQCLGCFGWYNDARHTGTLVAAS
jgi:hypothetical protein